MITRIHQEREAIKSELLGGNSPRIKQIHRVLTAYKGKMFKVDGQPTKAFEAVLEPLQLKEPSSGYYCKGGLKIIVQTLQVRAGYSNLELHLRATSTIEGEHGTRYIDHIIYMGKFDYQNYNYDFNKVDLKSVFDLENSIIAYNPHKLEDTLKAVIARNKLLEQLKELESTMPYYSYR